MIIGTDVSTRLIYFGLVWVERPLLHDGGGVGAAPVVSTTDQQEGRPLFRQAFKAEALCPPGAIAVGLVLQVVVLSTPCSKM